MLTKRVVILMTATLNPGPHADAVKLVDPKARADDYVRALKFWAGLKDSRIAGIVFCENSTDYPERSLGSSLSGSQLRRPIEWLGFDGNTRPAGMHYGYSELGILDYAMTHSRLLAESDLVLKVTGRLTFPRVSELLDRLDDEIYFVVDSRRAYSSETGPPIRVRTELMLFEKQFYLDHLYGRREEMVGRCSHIEEFMASKMLPFRNHPRAVFRFKTECPPVGRAGSTALNYQTGSSRLKSKLRQVLRRLVPGLWF